MMDFMSYGALPADYGIGAGTGAETGGGTNKGSGGRSTLTLATLEKVVTKQAAYTRKMYDLAWAQGSFTAERKAADKAYQAASVDLGIVRALRNRAKKKSDVTVADVPKAVRVRFPELFGGSSTGGGTGGGGKGGGAGNNYPTPTPTGAPTGADAGAGAGAGITVEGGTTELIPGISTTTLVLMGGGALALFLIMRNKKGATSNVFKGI